jgi:chlorobactene glucosyltransferase
VLIVLCLQLITLCILTLNCLLVRRIASFTSANNGPLVSILIPARNESHNIGRCLKGLLNQQYENYEIVVYDDNSDDDTPEIIKTYQAKSSHIRFIQGGELPEGWKGKSHACHKLSQAARGELLVFIDADVSCSPETISKVVSALTLPNTDAVTIFPEQICRTWAEKLTVPVMDMLLYCFLPIPLCPLFKKPSFSAATGQFFAFKRTAYTTIDGHRGVRNDVLEDIMLARQLKLHGKEVSIVSGVGSVRCRMYRTWREVRDGFSKNFFGVTNYSTVPFIFFVTFFQIIFLLPIVLFILTPTILLALSTGVIAITRLLHAHRFAHARTWATIGHPVTCIIVVIIAIRSWYWHKTERSVWKGRGVH